MTLRAVKFPAMNVAAEASPARLWSSLDAERRAPATAADPNPRSDFEEGFKAGEQAKESALGEALAAIERARTEIEDRMHTLEIGYRKQCAGTLAQIISAAAPAICEAAAQSAIARIFDDAAGDAPRADLTLTASPDVFDAIREVRGGDAPAGLSPDATLAPGTLQGRWRDGGLDCDVGRSLFAIVEFLNSQSGQAPEER